MFWPSAALDWSTNDKACIPIVILIEDEPVGFFVLHHSKGIQNYTENAHAMFLRSFFIDKNHQGKGYAGLAMNILSEFILHHLSQLVEIVLTVHEKNLPAKRLYEKSGYQYLGKNKMGRSGIEEVMHYQVK